MTLGRAERAGVAERAADGDEDGLDGSLDGDSLGLGVLRDGSLADSAVGAAASGQDQRGRDDQGGQPQHSQSLARPVSGEAYPGTRSSRSSRASWTSSGFSIGRKCVARSSW